LISSTAKPTAALKRFKNVPKKFRFDLENLDIPNGKSWKAEIYFAIFMTVSTDVANIKNA